MGPGMEFGLIAAAGWGVSSVAATYSARRMGTLVALLVSQATGAIVLTAVLAVMRPHLPALSGMTVLGLAGAGFLSLVGWLTYYRALEFGPVGIVSGTAATYGGVTAVLALVVLGEPLGRYGSIGGALAIAGVAAAATQTTGPRAATWLQAAMSSSRVPGPPGLTWQAPIHRRPWPGLLLALASAATYGTGAFWLGMYAAAAGGWWPRSWSMSSPSPCCWPPSSASRSARRPGEPGSPGRSPLGSPRPWRWSPSPAAVRPARSRSPPRYPAPTR